MNLGLPEKYAGDAGTIRAGVLLNLEKSISGAARTTSVAFLREDVDRGLVRCFWRRCVEIGERGDAEKTEGCWRYECN